MPFAVTASLSSQISSLPVRLHGLDALRGLAAGLVVLLHAGIPYMTNPLPFLVWPARDAHPCQIVDGLTWCTECFLMPLFYVLAGFFSQGLLISRGEREFLKGRTNRLLWTQLIMGLAILPACLGIWTLGWIADGVYAPLDLMHDPVPPELRAELYGMAHFWFLQNLYIYCLILWGTCCVLKRIRGAPLTPARQSFNSFDSVLASVWKPLIPAVPCALILYFDTRIVLGFYQSFFPILSKLLYYAIYFFVGVLLYRHRGELHVHARFGKTYLLVAGILFAAVLPMIHEHLTVALHGPRLAVMSGLLSLFAWFATFGLIAVFLRIRNADNYVTRYLAQASFWVYLIHLPFVTLTQIAITGLPIPAFGKFLLAGSTAIALALMTYHVFVRDTWIGEFLDGRRRRPVAAIAGFVASVNGTCVSATDESRIGKVISGTRRLKSLNANLSDRSESSRRRISDNQSRVESESTKRGTPR